MQGRAYPAGSLVVKTAQAFRPHVLDMFEPQDHPDDFQYPGGPPIPPYDSAGWTLAFQMGRVIGRTFSPGDEIIVTRMDHEGNVSPWLAMAEAYGLVVKWLPFNTESWRIEPEDLAALLTPRTKFLALNYASNMTGSINDVAALTALAKAAGALVWIDAVQLAPHRLPDVRAIGCDFLVCSSYKFFGPHLGVLWGREELLRALPPHRVRCQSDDIPDRFCTGTPQTELLAGLTATIDYLAWAGEANGHAGTRRERMAGAYQSFDSYEAALTRRLISGLTALPGVRLVGIANPNLFAHRVPTISFTHERVSTHRFAEALAAEDINIWSGHNYALEPARHLGLPEDESRQILEALFAHSVRPEHIYRHRWQPHDLVFWDNRSLIHLAAGTPDHLRRKLYRTTIEGDTPF